MLAHKFLKFKSQIFKNKFTTFANFKLSFTRKNWLLKFGFAYSLAQILEPKLLVHKILKFDRTFEKINKITFE